MRAARGKAAKVMQRRWGCPRAGHSPPEHLAEDLAELALDFAVTTGLVPRPAPGAPPPKLPPRCRTCPFAATYRPSPWAREVLEAYAAMRETKGGVTFEDLTGRRPHVWDARALRLLPTLTAEVMAADDEHRERERKAKGKT